MGKKLGIILVIVVVVVLIIVFATRSGEVEVAPSDFTTQQECEDAGFYWYNEACHGAPEVVEEPQDEDVEEQDFTPPTYYPEDFVTQEDCEGAGYYWYEEACYEDPQTGGDK